MSQLHSPLSITFGNRREAAAQLDEFFGEQDLARYIHIGKGDIVIDIGANLGMFAIYASLAGAAEVYAFEPAPMTFEYLQANVASFKNIHPYQLGIGSTNGSATFMFNPLTPAGSGFHEEAHEEFVKATLGRLYALRKNLSGHAPAEVLRLLDVYEDRLKGQEQTNFIKSDSEVRRLSTVLSDLGVKKVDLVKVDAEGMEVEVLEGITETDWQHIKQVVVEVHRPDLLVRCQEILSVFPYMHIEGTPERGEGTCYIYASRETLNGMQRLQANIILGISDQDDEDGDKKTTQSLLFEEYVQGLITTNFPSGGVKSIADIVTLAAKIYNDRGILLPLQLFMSGNYSAENISRSVEPS